MVTITLAKFNHLIFQITSRWLLVADSDESDSKTPILYLTQSGILWKTKLRY